MTIDLEAWRRAIDGEDPPPHLTPGAQVVEFPMPLSDDRFRSHMRKLIRAAVRYGHADAYRSAACKIRMMPLPEAERVARGMVTIANGLKRARDAR